MILPPDGWWWWTIYALVLMVVSQVRFGSLLPAILGGGLGVLHVLLVSPVFGDVALGDLSAVLFAQCPAFMVLAACHWSSLRRQGRPGGSWIMPGAALVVLIGLTLLSVVQESAIPSSRRFFWPRLDLLGEVALLLDIAIARSLSRVIHPVSGRWPADGWTVINSFCGYGSFILSCLTLPLFLPLALILPGNRERWIASAMRRAMRFVFAVTPTITWRCAGEISALDSARVVVSNHEGMLDILAACALPGTRTLLAKSWVFNAFPLGVAARAAGLRNSDLLLPEDYQEGVAATLPDPGVGIFVFPEGSRSRSGAIGRFRPGAFVLAKSLGCAVVPVAIAGSRLGIRPGSLWIHPSLVVSRVMPPMTLEPDETIRAFATRVRVAIVEARHRLLIDLLGTPRMALSRRHFFSGLGPTARRAVAEEERTGAWRTVLTAPADDGDWLFIGCGWSTIPVTVRQLLPVARIIAVEATAARRAVAHHAWLDPARDVVSDDPTTLVVPEALSGVVCWEPSADPRTAALLERALAAAPAVVLFAGMVAPPSGYAPLPTAVAGWSVFRRV